MGRRFLFSDVPVALPRGRSFSRADIRFSGVDQSGPSFEVRAFLNNPKAGTNTPTNLENGYAGAFHIYGFGQGDVDAKVRRIETNYSIPATEAIKSALEKGQNISITLVPVYYDTPPSSAEDALQLKAVSIETS
jgi:hypothetical protein